MLRMLSRCSVDAQERLGIAFTKTQFLRNSYDMC